MKKIFYSCLFLLFCFPVYSKTISETNKNNASDESFVSKVYGDFTYKVSNTWKNANNRDLYIPLNTWHNRATYDDEKIKDYNERPWGIGYGKSMYDENKNWNAFYIMAFKDSHNKFQPIAGYAWEKQWYFNQDLRVGLGYTVMVTARNDWFHYALPVPGILPLFSVSYGKLTLQNTYIPGTYNNGNVWFMWARYQL